jgi:lipopolysaccharide transport system ATP-binding protein
MSNMAIQASGLGKQYRIGSSQLEKNFRETMSDALSFPFRRAGQLLRGHAYGAAELNEELWALKDVSFEVPYGEVLGIIGRNGSGKSTLLKVLSRITEPTEGEVLIHGRVGALLEVGTGFHQELTGRENVYLNGAILGMKRREINRKFDEIIAFSGIERFMDTPVKHYSSGMRVRLGFAVAAHLEPDILIVDEVLAVGDAAFQKKCLGKMNSIAREGRTVLYVSHKMASIQQLCNRVIVLEDGQIHESGETELMINNYMRLTSEYNSAITIVDAERHQRVTSDDVRFTDFYMTDVNGERTTQIKYGDSLRFHFVVQSKIELSNLSIAIQIGTLHGVMISTIYSDQYGAYFDLSIDTPLHITLCLDELRLTPRLYSVSAIAIRQRDSFPYDRVIDPLRFEILPIKIDPTLPLGPGILTPQANWQEG